MRCDGFLAELFLEGCLVGKMRPEAFFPELLLESALGCSSYLGRALSTADQSHRSLSETRYAAGPGSETTQRPEGKGGPPQSSLRTQAGPTIDETYRGGPSGETKSPAYRDYPTSRSTKAQRPSGPRIQPTETRQVSEDLQARNAQLSEELRSLRAVQGREGPQAALMAEAASAAAAAALAATAAEEAIQYAGTLQDALTDVRTAYLKNRATRSKTRPTEMPL